jgi:hypothetical protein
LGAKNSHRITKRFATDFSAPAALTSLLFRPSGARNHWKNTVFSRTWIFFLLTISSLILRSDLLSSSPVFSASSHLSGCVCSRMPSHSTWCKVCLTPTTILRSGKTLVLFSTLMANDKVFFQEAKYYMHRFMWPTLPQVLLYPSKFP